MKARTQKIICQYVEIAYSEQTQDDQYYIAVNAYRIVKRNSNIVIGIACQMAFEYLQSRDNELALFQHCKYMLKCHYDKLHDLNFKNRYKIWHWHEIREAAILFGAY